MFQGSLHTRVRGDRRHLVGVAQHYRRRVRGVRLGGAESHKQE